MATMNINRKSKLYRSLRGIYQPIKVAKEVYQELLNLPRRKAKLLEYEDKDFRGLHIGCGPFYLSGWINTDLLGTPDIDFSLNISTNLPLPDNFFDAIYGSEVIEHIELEEARLFFREAYRILKPGGVMRLTTPDLTEICRVFLGLRDGVSVKDFESVWLDGEFSKDIWINSLFRAWGHQHLWTFESLAYEMKKVGFDTIYRCERQETKSNKSQLNDLDYRYGNDEKLWIFTTLIIEAWKP